MPPLLLTSQAGVHSEDLARLFELENLSSFVVMGKNRAIIRIGHFLPDRMKVVAVAEPVEHRRKRQMT